MDYDYLVQHISSLSLFTDVSHLTLSLKAKKTPTVQINFHATETSFKARKIPLSSIPLLQQDAMY